MDKLDELIGLLARGELDREAVEARAAAMRNAREDPDLAWLRDADEAELLQASLLSQLSDVLMVSDQLDDLHVRISQAFQPALPGFPYDRRDFWPDDYFEWLDEVVMPRGREVMMLGNPEDRLAAAVVRREDTARILALAVALGLIVEKSTQRRYA